MTEIRQEPLPAKSGSESESTAFAQEQPIRQKFFGIRDKLILIFIAIKVLPLIALTLLAATQVTHLGETFKSKSNDVIETTKKLVTETGNLATASSIQALDLKSREAIERLTTEIALDLADFLYTRDDDILQAAALPISEDAYKQFLSVYHREVVYHPEWVLNEEQNAWMPKTPTEKQIVEVEYGSADNEKDFHYMHPYRPGIRKMQPLYHEMTFVDLTGQEKIKISATDLLSPKLRNVSKKENTWCKAETYFEEAQKLKQGEIAVSRVIGPYVGSPVVGVYTPKKAAELGIPFKPEEAGYAGKENPVGKRFQGIVRWTTPVFKEGKKIGYVTLALDHTHIMEFVDHVIPTEERYSDISDASSGNYAFIWDYAGRSIAHPRDHSIVGFDPETGEQTLPWISSELLDIWQKSNGSFKLFEEKAPSFLDQTIQKRPVPSLTREGYVALDCRYLNFAPQCIGWYNLTQHGGSGSFLILWTGLWKLTTAAAIPYYTGMYAESPRGFGFVTIGADVNEFHSSATETAAKIQEITQTYETDLEEDRQETLEAINTYLEESVTELTVYTAAMVVIVILIAIWMASYLTKKLTTIIKGVRNFQSGHFSSRLQVESKDELGQLSMALNDMSDQLQKSIAQFQTAKEHAEESDKAKSLFLANMSHEIRTPMNAIIGMTYLAMKAKTDEKRQSLMKTVGYSAESLLRLLDDILDFSKMEAGQLQLNKAPFNLRNLLEGIISTMNVPAIEKGLKLRINSPDSLPGNFIGDELRLRQILLNLVGNAIKFTKEGSVVITVDQEENNGQDLTPMLHFIVTDTGIGIAKDKLSQIFNRFEQADTSYSREYSGTGLGLSICKQLIILMQGKIWATSLVNVGSSFHFIIPLEIAQEIEEASNAQHELPETQLKDLKILLVDDNEVNRNVASMMLEQDHQVTTAENGLEALTVLSEKSFDLILMDVQMPQIDGITATKIIRSLEQGVTSAEKIPAALELHLRNKLHGRHIPIVAMTAHAMSEDRANCLDAGMDDYISKPFQYSRLIRVLHNLLPHLQFIEPSPVFAAPSPPPAEKKQKITVIAVEREKENITEADPVLALITRSFKETTNLPDVQIARLVASARTSLQENLDMANKALQEHNMKDMAIVSHTIKGILLQCGINQLAEKSQEMYAAAKNEAPYPFDETLELVRKELASFLNG